MTLTIPKQSRSKTKKTSALGIGIKKLQIAYSRVKSDSFDDFLPDLIDHREYHLRLDENLTSLIKNIQIYQPSDTVKFNVPKSSVFSRPGTYLRINDRIVYQAIVDSFAVRLDQQLEPRDVVFGFRASKNPASRRLLDANLPRWKKLRRALRQLKQSGYVYLARTDLVGYFEHINHQLLIEDLERLGVKKSTRDLLDKLLHRWATSPNHGLPQNTEPSSVLGSFYLDPIDKIMTRTGYKYMRFMDDIFIAGRNKLEVRKGLQLLESECRKRRLFLNTRKTEILEGSNLTEYLAEDKDDREAIEYSFETGATKEAQEKLHILAKKIGGKRDLDERLFKFTLTRLGRINDPLLLKKSLGLLEDHPQLTDYIARYLRNFASRRPSVEKRIFEFCRWRLKMSHFGR